MISTLVNLLGGYYESNDFAKVEAIAHSINKAVPGDEVSLKFLGLVYYRTGRTKDAIRLFNRVHRRASPRPKKLTPAPWQWPQWLGKPHDASRIWHRHGVTSGVR